MCGTGRGSSRVALAEHRVCFANRPVSCLWHIQRMQALKSPRNDIALQKPLPGRGHEGLRKQRSATLIRNSLRASPPQRTWGASNTLNYLRGFFNAAPNKCAVINDNALTPRCFLLPIFSRFQFIFDTAINRISLSISAITWAGRSPPDSRTTNRWLKGGRGEPIGICEQ
jgi:hypothetical protein